MNRCLLLLLPLALAGAAPAAPTLLHPVPRQTELLGGWVSPGAGLRIETRGEVSSSALELLRQTTADLPENDSPSRLILGTRQSPEVAAFLEELPETSGAYRIKIDATRIVLAGHDVRGTYYAALTFAKLLGKDGRLPTVDIIDWPEVPDRGVVEGFYGTPWSHEKRLRVIEYLGRHKMDTYIYGPKDDPYHSSPKWREPYPADEAAKIRELADSSAKHHVDFYWAIHPGKDIRWNEEDYGKVLAKFEAMYELGVRAFAAFFDDISGEGTKADRQADLLDRLHRDFVVKKGDVRPLVMCPTQYNRAWSGGDYLDVLGTRLDPSIHVMWTGDTVVHDLDRQGMEWINSKLRRKAYIWWNNPVSDYVRDHLLMGPVYGNELDIGPLYGGFVSNPMERPEASRVALFGVADYTWNPDRFDSEASFLAAMREIMPGAPEAFETFCRHNADLGRNTHGYRRVESVGFAPLAESFMTSLRDGDRPESNGLRREFEAIAAAPAKIRHASDNPLLIAEISPWLDAFEQLGRAGLAALDTRDALADDPAKAWNSLAIAHAALEAMTRIDRTQNQNPYQPGVKTGSLVVTPMVRELVEILDVRLLSQLSGGPIAREVPVTSAKERETLPQMVDGDDESFAYIKEVQKAGDWFGLDFGAPKEIRRIRLLLGRKDDDHDRIHDGVLEGSVDGRWQVLGPVDAARIDLTLDPPRTVSALRVRIVKPGSPTKPDLWTAIRSFEVDPEQPAMLRTDVRAFEKIPLRIDDTSISLSPLLEIHPLPAGSFLGLLFPGLTRIDTLSTDLEIAGASRLLTLEANRGGSEWHALPTSHEGTRLNATVDHPVLAVRVRNTGGKPLDARLRSFVVTRAAATPTAAATDGDLGSIMPLDRRATIPLPTGSGAQIIILATPGIAVTASAELAGDGRALGSIRSGLGRFTIPAGTTAITLESDKPTAIHEMIRLIP